MRKLLILISFFSLNQVYAQPIYCEPCGNDFLGIVPGTLAEQFRSSYTKKFHKDSVAIKRYSQSVDFSRAELVNFLSWNDSSVYCGFNVYFIAGDSSERPGHESKDQIGLALVPRKRTGFPDFKAYVVENVAFNEKGDFGTVGSIVRKPTKEKVEELRKHYKLIYPNKGEKVHTRYALISELTTSFIRDFVRDDKKEEYKIYRFYFITYNKGDVVCQQGHKDQISIMIIPVSIGGPDFDAFTNYQGSGIYKGKKLLLNHGSLCPNYCPDGDNN